jgi:radical SAM protein with 4Fe4S-binding SPASM domain
MRRQLPIASSSTPPLAPRARDVDRKARPIYAVWELTLRCDLACRHCSSRAGRARADELDTVEALGVARQLAELGVREVTLIGGEAYLRDDWLDVVRAVRSGGMRCTMVTGGRALSRERAAAARDAGLEGVSVSVDGLAPTHDALRGRGAFDGAMRALAAARDAGLQISANTQIGRANLDEIPALFERLADAGIAAWQAQITVPMGRAADRDDIILQPWQMLALAPMLARVKARADARGVVFWPGNNVGYFGPHEAELRACHRGACGAGRSTIGIESNGNVKPCPSLPSEYVGGNVRDHALVDIWERAPRLGFMRARTRADLWGRCASCYYADDCLGGCSWTADALLGRPGNNPYCHHRALELAREGRRERVVRRAPPEGRPFDRGAWELVEEEGHAS